MDDGGRLRSLEDRIRRLESLVGQLTSSNAVDNARRGALVSGASTTALTANYATTAGSAATATTATLAQGLVEVTTQAAVSADVADATYDTTEEDMLNKHDALLVKITDTFRTLGAWVDP